MNLNLAIDIATEAHKNQKDKVGKPYITHVMRVMERCKTEEEKIVAALHDVVEDTSTTLDDLKKSGFDESIISAVDAITQRQGEEKTVYIERVKANPIALRVKINDLEDNMDIRRLPELKDKDVERLKGYLLTYRMLLNEISSNGKSHMDELKEKFANAYQPWSSDDDLRLEKLFCEKKSVKELSEIFSRNRGAIESRIRKLELREKYF